jgi:hypothetical protein
MSIVDDAKKATNENPRAVFLAAAMLGNPSGTPAEHAKAADDMLAELEKRCAPAPEG